MDNIQDLFEPQDEPVLIGFQLPEIEQDNPTYNFSIEQIQRLVDIVTLIIKANCEITHSVIPTDKEGELLEPLIFFAVEGDTTELKILLEETGFHQEIPKDLFNKNIK